MLGDEELIARVPKEAKAREHHPGNDAPRTKAIFDHWHELNLHLNNVGDGPLCEEERPVHNSGEKDGSRYPSVEPVESLIGDASEKSDWVELAGEEIYQWNLGDCDPCCAEADLLPLVGVHGIAWFQDRVNPQQTEDDDPVYGQEEPLANRKRAEVFGDAASEVDGLRI